MADIQSTAKTEIIRSPAQGPEPCNTLVYLRCWARGIDVPLVSGEPVRSKIRFQTEFRIDGYLQSHYDWYKENTLASATATLRFLNTTTDLSFLMAVDSVTPDLQQLDGRLSFDVDVAAWFENDAWFGGHEDLVLVACLSAYVLCFEPRTERPASGAQRTPWAVAFEQGPKLSDVLGKRVRPKASNAVPCEPGLANAPAKARRRRR
ncbi:hypothetical protein [Cupriavidus pauculus]|uniref:hypothetical protein n=1 Tax=Cupriavidus pauculus TaxID=82633 RepID=UPI001EE1A821|nr:hypothetical protein [Cupriavidus pauculus]GJG94055.1 hypothetical protein CBA19C6_06220 [Cupriavidus pauculus]